MQFALHHAADLATAAAAFARTGHAQIAPFLEDEAAERLRAALLTSERWREVFNNGASVYEIDREGQKSLDPAARERIDSALATAARSGFQYRYESIRVPDEPGPNPVEPELLGAFAAFMNGPELREALDRVVGPQPATRFVDAQATLFRKGDRLTGHDDDVDGKMRKAAYVFGLTPRWRIEWGGLLLFHGPDGNVTQGLTPRFNCLNIFAVPQLHSVSQVADYVTEPRLSVTGWLRTGRDQSSGS